MNICIHTIYIKTYWPNQLGLQNTRTASMQRGKTSPKWVLDMILNMVELRGMQSTLHCHSSQVHFNRSGSTWKGPIYKSNRTKMRHYVQYPCACRNIVNTIKTNGHSSLEKYTSHTLFERVTKGVLPLLGAGSHSLNWNTDFKLWSPTDLTSSRSRVIKLFGAHLLPVSSKFALNSTRRQSRLSLDVFDRIHL